MSFFYRRKPFIFVQELPKLEDTKELLASKLELLKQQIRLSGISVNKQDLVTPQFAKCLLYWLDFQEKITKSLIHLVASSSLTWTFLLTFRVSETKQFIFGEFNKEGFILDTEKIFKNPDFYFFSLLKIGSIDIETWVYLKKLSSLSSNLSILCLNDGFYYECKNLEIVTPIEEFGPFKNIEKSFTDFLRNPLRLSNDKPILWNFLKASKKLKNYVKVGEILLKSAYKYEEIRSRPETKAFLSPSQYQELFYSLSNLDSFNSLYQAAFELEVFADNTATPEVLKFCIVYFLEQDNAVFLPNNPVNSRYNFYEKLVHATLWVDLILFICKNRINLFSYKKPLRNQIQTKFKRACELELSGIKDSKAIQDTVMFDLSIVTFLVSKIEQLRNLEFYKKHYSRIVGPLLSLSW